MPSGRYWNYSTWLRGHKVARTGCEYQAPSNRGGCPRPPSLLPGNPRALRKGRLGKAEWPASVWRAETSSSEEGRRRGVTQSSAHSQRRGLPFPEPWPPANGRRRLPCACVLPGLGAGSSCRFCVDRPSAPSGWGLVPLCGPGGQHVTSRYLRHKAESPTLVLNKRLSWKIRLLLNAPGGKLDVYREP